MALLSRLPPWNGGFKFGNLPKLPKADQWIRRDKSRLMLGSKQFAFWGTHCNERSCAIQDPTERAGLVKRIAEQGFNAVRLQGFDNKLYSDGPGNGPWTPGYAGFDERYMQALDAFIDELNQAGVYVWFCFNHYWQPLTSAGLPVGTSAASSATAGSGMHVFSQYRDLWKTHIAAFRERVNTATLARTGQAVKWKNNPGIAVWQDDNENGASDSMLRSAAWWDPIAAGTAPHSYWTPTLTAMWAAHWSANYAGDAMPDAGALPSRAQWTTNWTTTEQRRWVRWWGLMDQAIAAEMYAWFKADSNALYCAGEYNYKHPLVSAQFTDLCSRHYYLSAGGAKDTDTPNYATRGSALGSNSGYPYGEEFTCLPEDVPYVRTEDGSYGFGLYDFESPAIGGIVQALTGGSGLFVLTEGQNHTPSTQTGLTNHPHTLGGWSSRRLVHRLMAPLWRKGPRLKAHSNTRTNQLGDEQLLDVQVAAKKAGVCTTDYLAGTGGSAWSWLRERVRWVPGGASHSMTTDTTVKFAQMGAGVTDASGQIFARVDQLKVLTPQAGVSGWVSTIENGSAGALTASGLAAPTSGVCLAVNDDDGPLFGGSGLLGVFRHTTIYTATPGDVFAGAAVGETVTSFGVQSNTRQVTPDAFGLVLNTAGAGKCDLSIMGINLDDGSEALISTTYDGNAGTVSFTTDPNYALYRWVPKARPLSSRRRVSRPAGV